MDKYILVFQDVRGKNMSEGVYEDIRPYISDKQSNVDIDEASDTYDTAEWLLHNTNNNGNMGVFGISYPGFYSTMAALSDHPAIKAVSPQAPVTDWFRGDDTHHNGALFLLDMFGFEFWFEHINKPNFWNNYSIDPKQVNPTDIVHTDVYNDYLSMGPVRNFTRLMGDSCKFWKDMTKHPDIDQWWEERNVAYHCKEIKPAVMVVGGLFDAEDCYGAFTTYNAIRRQSPNTEVYLIEGPWAHGTWSRGARGYLGDIWFGNETNMDYYLQYFEYPFFSYYLNNKRGMKPVSKAVVFQTGENQWKGYLDGWESDRKKKAFYLRPDGTIGDEIFLEETTTYISDPDNPVPFMGTPQTRRPEGYMTSDQRFAATRQDVAVFTSPTLTSPIVLDGNVTAELGVQISNTDCDFIVKLIDVFPEDFDYPDEIHKSMGHGYDRPIMSGYQMLVRTEVMRGKYRNCMDIDSIAFNSTTHAEMNGYRFNPTNPEPFVPGKPETLTITLPDIAHTFMPGHKMMVQIQSSCFPLIDRNPQTFCNIYECGEDAFQKCTVNILHTKEHPTRIWLPIVK